MKKKIILSVIAFILVAVSLINVNVKSIYASAGFETTANFKSSVLIDRATGTILQDSNCHQKMPIASVTKLMTILLTLENIEDGNITLEDKVMVSENASGMGGSQIFLDANQEYCVGDLLKSVIVASANDSSVALAETISGSENNFVRLMNQRAKELGLNDTNYSNCTGLPSAEGYSSAYDQSIILNKVLTYDTYHTYSSIWLEDFAHPDGRTTVMTNTNKLSKFYSGCIGGKTGSTNEAKYCLAVGASRNNMDLIAVVLGAENSKTRFNLASELLNYGFDNFESKTIFNNQNLTDKTIKIKGFNNSIKLEAKREFSALVNKGENCNYSINYNLPTMLNSVKVGQVVGNVEIIIDGVVVDCIDVLSLDTVDEASVWDYIREITKA